MPLNDGRPTSRGGSWALLLLPADDDRAAAEEGSMHTRGTVYFNTTDTGRICNNRRIGHDRVRKAQIQVAMQGEFCPVFL